MTNTEEKNKKHPNTIKRLYLKVYDFLFPEKKLAQNILIIAEKIIKLTENSQMTTDKIKATEGTNKTLSNSKKEKKQHYNNKTTNPTDPIEKLVELMNRTVRLAKLAEVPSYLAKLSFEQSRQIKYAQDYAYARYAAYVDTDFRKKEDSQKNEISNTINKFPLEIIALSLIAEKNQENQFSSCIRDDDDLRAKIIDTPQVKKLTEKLKEQLYVMDIEELTNQTKKEALPYPNLNQISNNGKYSTRTATGRE